MSLGKGSVLSSAWEDPFVIMSVIFWVFNTDPKGADPLNIVVCPVTEQQQQRAGTQQSGNMGTVPQSVCMKRDQAQR